MASPFLAEIRIFPFDFAPRGWAQCNGQILPLSQHTALFSLLGTSYGGDGKSSFGLPNLQGSTPLNWGQGPGLSDYAIGQTGGSEFVTVISSEMPGHSHALMAVNSPADQPAPNETSFARTTGASPYLSPTTNPPPLVQLSSTAIGLAGGSLPHNNMMPYLTVNFCIALEGIFPPRS